MTKQHEITQSDQTGIKERNENIQMKILSWEKNKQCSEKLEDRMEKLTQNVVKRRQKEMLRGIQWAVPLYS